MIAGLRVRDASGAVIVDTTTRLGTILGTVLTGKTDGYVENQGFALGTPLWSIVSLDTAYNVIQPTVTVTQVNGVWRLSWTWKSPGATFNHPCRITYGVY